MRLLIISLPLFGSLSLLLLGRYLGFKGGRIIAIVSMAGSMIFSYLTAWKTISGITYTLPIKTWFQIGPNSTSFELLFDLECSLMICLISTITLIVIIYSTWYLNTDAHLTHFLGLLLVFSMSMYILVSSRNFLFTFFGWECVGLVSYLLINFWSNSTANNKSAIKALLFNRVGDISFLFALFYIFYIISTFDIQTLNLLYGGVKGTDIILYCFIFAAMAKSAQIFLHCWLGDAMAGPTPVSALLHAATMVTAGVYLIIKCHTLLVESQNDNLRLLLIIIGSSSILFAGITSIAQYDIKKIIAFSTCSQIGFMFLALAFSKPFYASLYHLLSHGFFKALLFLTAGLLIHNMSLDQDLRKYGKSVWTSPLPYFFFLLGSLALMGLPPLSGFFSKDLILLHSFSFESYYITTTLFIGSLLSSIYSIKILYYTFFNNTSLPSITHATPHNSKRVVTSEYLFLFPFFFLLVGSLFLGYLLTNLLSSPEVISIPLEYSLSLHLYPKLILFCLPLIALILFILYIMAYNFNLKTPVFLISVLQFSNRKFFFDPIYNYYLVLPSLYASYHFAIKFIDRGFLELFGPVGLFRLFFYFPKYFSLKNQKVSNLPFTIFFFMLSFFFIVTPLFI